MRLLSGRSGRAADQWLSAQAASGFVSYDAGTHRFSLSPEQAAVLGALGSTIGRTVGREVVRGIFGLPGVVGRYVRWAGRLRGYRHELIAEVVAYRMEHKCGRAMGISQTSVFEHVNALEAKGKITRTHLARPAVCERDPREPKL